MTVTWLWSGAVTSSGARVHAKTTGTSARLAVADNSAMASPTFFGPGAPSLNVVSFTPTGLASNTQFWYRIEDDGVIDTTKTGQFRTHKPVGTPFSFGFIASACAGLDPDVPGTSGLVPTRISNHTVFDEIRSPKPLFFAHMGDLHYYNLGSGSFGIVGGGSLANYRTAYDDVLAQSRQAQLYREVPIVYGWDDHCYGPNDSDGTYVDKGNAAAVYRERVPSYPLVEATGSIYHSFQVGRVLYVVLDGRYNRDAPTAPAPRTYLGAAQVAWLNNLLATSTAAFLIVQMAQPINSGGTTSWGGYPEERANLYQMFGDHGWIGRMFAIAGDQHQFGWDAGSHTAGFPLYTCAPLDSSQGIAGIAYDLGYSGLDRGQFGWFRILDWGKTIGVRARGLITNV